MSQSIYKCCLVGFIFLLCTNLAFAQNSRNRYKSSQRKAQVACPTFGKEKGPEQGIGIKLGDPFAITYKFYGTENFAIAIDAGSPASGLYNKYYRDKFSEYTVDSLGEGQSLSYLSHSTVHDWQLEGKILYSNNFPALTGLQWYLGAGWQLRNTKIRYDYFIEAGPGENELASFNVSRFAMGPVGAAGIEYRYMDFPLAAFMEAELFADIIKDPGWVRLQGGVGLRYIF